jgi:hypothetical protein
MSARTVVIAVGFAVAATLPAAAAHAQAKAPSTVTIKAEGVDLSGKVKSPRQSCKTDRKVVVWKQIGARGGGDDQKMFSDLAGSDGSWDTGNTGIAGHFYARIKATPKCKGDTSPTIHATR